LYVQRSKLESGVEGKELEKGDDEEESTDTHTHTRSKKKTSEVGSKVQVHSSHWLEPLFGVLGDTNTKIQIATRQKNPVFGARLLVVVWAHPFCVVVLHRSKVRGQYQDIVQVTKRPPSRFQ